MPDPLESIRHVRVHSENLALALLGISLPLNKVYKKNISWATVTEAVEEVNPQDTSEVAYLLFMIIG